MDRPTISSTAAMRAFSSRFASGENRTFFSAISLAVSPTFMAWSLMRSMSLMQWRNLLISLFCSRVSSCRFTRTR